MKVLLRRLLLLVIASATAATAQTFSQRSFAAGSGPGSSVVADMNGDGLPDIVIANTQGTPGISVLLNNGDGTFRPPILFTLFETPDQIAVGDINGDGFPDVVYTSKASNMAVVYGRGDGTFSTAIGLDFNGGIPNSVALADMNGDGRLDVVYGTDSVAPSIPSKIQIALNTGNDASSHATFTGARQTVTQATGTVSRLFSVTTGDINGDGKPDVAYLFCCSNEPAAPVIVIQAINTGNGAFSFTEPDIGTAVRVVAHDFGTGRAALVLPYGPLACNGCFKNQGFSVIYNQPDGTTRKTGAAFSGTEFITGDVAFGDYDGDGLQDIALTASGSLPGSSGQDEILILERSAATGNFSGITTVPVNFGQFTGSLGSARLHHQLRGDDIVAVQAAPQNVDVLTNVTPAPCLPNTPSVLICSPGSTENNVGQVRFFAGAVAPSGFITALRFYVDNKELETFFSQTDAPTLQAGSVNTITPGSHFLAVVGYTSTGGFVKSTLTFTVH